MLNNDQSSKSAIKSSVVIKAGMWFTVCNIITKGIGFFTTPIFTRLLTKAEFGDYNNFTTWMGIILFVTSLNLDASLIRARFDFADDIDRYVGSMMCLSIFSTLCWFFIFLANMSIIENILQLNSQYIYMLFMYLVFYPAIQLYQTKEKFEYKYKSTVAITLLIVISTSLLSVILVLTMNNRLAGRIMGSVIPVIVIGLIIAVIIIYRAKGVCVEYWKYAIPFTLPFIPHLLSMYLLGSMDKVMIKQLCGAKDLAIYSLAYTVGTIVTLLINSMNGAFGPWLVEQLSKQNYEIIRKISVPYVIIFVIFSIIAILVTPEILLFLGGREYAEAVRVIPQVFAGCLMQFIYTMYVNVEQFEKKTVGMAFASVFAALFNYITNDIFLQKFGYVAASYTTFFSYLLLMLLHILLVQKIIKKDIYNTKIILTIGIIGSLILIYSNIILDNFALRYLFFCLLIGCSGLIAYRKRKVLIGLFTIR